MELKTIRIHLTLHGLLAASCSIAECGHTIARWTLNSKPPWHRMMKSENSADSRREEEASGTLVFAIMV